jgi:hypothetical protein
MGEWQIQAIVSASKMIVVLYGQSKAWESDTLQASTIFGSWYLPGLVRLDRLLL